jgi:CRP-like cAMP-binding protein
MFKIKKNTKKQTEKQPHTLEDKRVKFSEGDIIIIQGREPKMAYLIKKGKVSVVKKIGDTEQEVARLGPGQIIGEMSIIKGYKCSASIVAIGEVEAQPIPPAYINKELAQMNTVMRQVVIALVERLYKETFTK